MMKIMATLRLQAMTKIMVATRLAAASTKIDAYFTELGYKKIGFGDDASVWRKSGSQKVVKAVHKDRARPMLEWIDYVKTHHSQHFPKFGNVQELDYAGEAWVLVEMDFYKPLPRNVQKQIAEAWSGVSKAATPRDGDYLLDVMLRVSHAGHKLGFDSDYVQGRSIVKNLMAHGDTIVIVDPWTGE